MAFVQLKTYYDIPIHCPFCGAAASDSESGEHEIKGCLHLQMISAGGSVIHLSENAALLCKTSGLEIVRDDFEFRIISDEDDNPDPLAILSKLPDAVIFEQIVGPPSLMETHTVFAINEVNHVKSKE